MLDTPTLERPFYPVSLENKNKTWVFYNGKQIGNNRNIH